MENDKLKSYQPFHIQYVNYTWALIKTIKNNQTVYDVLAWIFSM